MAGTAVYGRVTAFRGALAVALIAVTSLFFVAPAEAACGGPVTAKPQKDANYGRAPVTIGDSPMLLAVPNLAEKGFLVNARGCRQYAEGIDVLRNYEKRNRLGKVVVIALGSNGFVEVGQIHEALRIIGKDRILVLVTPRELGGGSGSDADIVRKEAKEHNRIRLLDWVEHASGHGSWFQPDGLHLTFEGAEAMADFFADLVFDILKPPK